MIFELISVIMKDDYIQEINGMLKVKEFAGTGRY